MTDERLKRLIAFLKQIEKLKLVERRVKISSRTRWESSAEHSFDLALWTWIFSKDLPRALDLLRTIKLVLMHDLVEIYAGDTFIFDHVSRKTKKQREDTAARKLFGQLPSDLKQEFEALWREFEANKTKESKVARSMDRLQPILQNIVSGGYSWKKHKITEAEIHQYKLDHMLHDEQILKIYKKLIRGAKQAKLI